MKQINEALKAVELPEPRLKREHCKLSFNKVSKEGPAEEFAKEIKKVILDRSFLLFNRHSISLKVLKYIFFSKDQNDIYYKNIDFIFNNLKTEFFSNYMAQRYFLEAFYEYEDTNKLTPLEIIKTKLCASSDLEFANKAIDFYNRNLRDIDPPEGRDIKQYVSEIVESWENIIIMGSSAKIVELAANANVNTAYKLDQIIRAAEETKQALHKSGKGKIALNHCLNNFVDVVGGIKSLPHLITPYPNLNKIMGGGIRAEDFIILGGRPGSGKTSLAFNIMSNLVFKNKKRVCFLNFDMALESSVFFYKKIANNQGVLEREFINSAKGCESPILDFRSINKELMESVFYSSETGAARYDLIIIDYIQKLGDINEDTNNVGNIRLSLNKSIDILRSFIIKYKTPVIALSQMNRSYDNKVEDLSRLQETDRLAFEADAVITISNSPSAPSESRLINLNIVKNRRGACSKIPFSFTGKSQIFEETA